MDVEYEIQQIIDSHLGRTGRSGPTNISAPCPFHTKADGTPERNPSFAINVMTGLYICHSCGASGNLYVFLKNMGVSRQEIETKYRTVIDAARNNLPPPPEYRSAQFADKSPIDSRLLGLLDYCPKDLVDDGFLPQVLQHFEVGFDRWHYRDTYPIRDLAGQLTAINGRSVTGAQPRHKIYDTEFKSWGMPERTGWEKSNVLYNAHTIYPAVYHNVNPEYVVVVEGFKACMWLWQAGIRNVVALMGHNLSVPQQWILESMGAKVYFFLDNNWQGWSGVKKAGSRLIKNMWVRVITYPERLIDDEDAQPDNCTPEEIHAQLAEAVDLYDYRLRPYLAS